MKPSEQSVAEVVVAHLEGVGADVYQEVGVPGGFADIVCRVGRELWIVETKTQLSLSLLYQAMERRELCHRVFVAAPPSKTLRMFVTLARELGIGVLAVRDGDPSSSWSYDHPKVWEECPSRRWNSRPVKLASSLRPEHKTHAKAGTGGGGRWTPWRDTCEQLARIVRAQPGITLKAAIDTMTHHYRSAAGARSSLAKWIEVGKVPGVRLNKQTSPVSLEVAP